MQRSFPLTSAGPLPWAQIHVSQTDVHSAAIKPNIKRGLHAVAYRRRIAALALSGASLLCTVIALVLGHWSSDSNVRITICGLTILRYAATITGQVLNISEPVEKCQPSESLFVHYAYILTCPYFLVLDCLGKSCQWTIFMPNYIKVWLASDCSDVEILLNGKPKWSKQCFEMLRKDVRCSR